MKTKKVDLFLWIPLFVIMMASFGIMYHAKFISPLYQNNLFKQVIWYVIGIFCVFLLSRIRFKWVLHYSFYLYVFNIILLILVLIVGQRFNGARAWFSIGPFSLQPSEFMKISLSLYLVHFTSTQKFNVKKNELQYIIEIFLLFLIPSVFVFLEPDTGAIIFYALIAFTTLLFSGINKKWFVFFFFLICAMTSIFFYLFFFQQDLLIEMLGTTLFYRMDRLIHLNEGMQIENALVALGSMKFLCFNINNPSIYIPESLTDFAFTLASIVFGFFGIIIILICYLLINIYFIYKIKKESQKEKKWLIIIFFTIFVFNQFYNILMNIGLMPIMGIPLPFLSYGGSTLLCYFIFLGLIMQPKKKN